MMKVATSAQCMFCGRELKALMEKSDLNCQSDIAGHRSYCSILCFQHHLEQLRGSNYGQRTVADAIKHTGCQVCLEECSNKAQAEFVFFLHLLRSISDCDIMKLILSRENLLQRLQTFQGQQNKRPLADLVFSTDIMKLALNFQMTPERVNHIVARIWEIASEARDKLQATEDEINLDDQIDSVDREIFQAIAKTTVDNILDLGSNRTIKIHNHKNEINDNKNEGQSSSSKEPMLTESNFKDKSECRGLYFLELDDDPLRSMHVIIKDNGNIHRRFRILDEENEISDITFQSIAESICREDLKPGVDFVFLKRYFLPKIDDDAESIERFNIVDWSEPVSKLIKEDLYFVNSCSVGNPYNSSHHVIIHLRFPSENFVKDLDYFYYIQSPLEMLKVQDMVSKYLTKEYLPVESHAKLRLDIKDVSERITGLKDLCVSHMIDHKVISIEVLPTDIIFEAEDEELIYSKEELDYFKTCEHEVRSERFLLNLALRICVELSTLKLWLRELLSDSSLTKYKEAKADRLRVYRCLRTVRILSKEPNKYSFHKLSFVFAGKYSVLDNQSSFIKHSLHNHSSTPLTVNYNIYPDASNWLLKLINSESLPKILCIRHNMGMQGHNFLQLFMKQEIYIDTKSRYELKAVLQTEFDPRGVCSCISIKGESISNFSIFGPISTKFLAGRPPKSLILLFELQTQWLLLENSPST